MFAVMLRNNSHECQGMNSLFGLYQTDGKAGSTEASAG